MDHSMPNWLKQRAELTPKRLAIITKDEQITFEQLHKRVLHRVQVLSTYGVKQGNHVAILMKNSIDMIETIHAVMSLGSVAVMLNTRLTNQELQWQIQDVEASHLICNEEFHDKVLDLKHEIQIIISENMNEKKIDNQFVHFDMNYSTNQVATIMYTSGTTGNPKGVLQTFENHWASAMGSALNLGIQPSDRWLLSVPLFHISGLSILMRGVIYGIGIVLHERFEAEKMNHSIMKDNVTITSVVTTMLHQMLDNLGNNQYPSSFRCMLAGGGPVPKSLLEECQKREIPIYQTYGMTETSSQVVTLTPEHSLTKIGSAGKPLFSCEIKIINNGKECLANEEGEIFVKGPNITKGYWKREEATKEALQKGWLKTGDQGYLDDDGFLFVLDRRSDLIISGGENVYPAEIESILLSHPKVKEAGVIGIEDKKWGQTPHAFVVLREEISNTELLDFCRSRLAAYKVPKAFSFVENLPRNASNKLLRRELKEKIMKERNNDKD